MEPDAASTRANGALSHSDRKKQQLDPQISGYFGCRESSPSPPCCFKKAFKLPFKSHFAAAAAAGVGLFLSSSSKRLS